MLKWANYTIACNEQKGEIFKKHVRVIKNTKKKKNHCHHVCEEALYSCIVNILLS